jgi:Flp pilus assembly pilin Flp
LLKALRMHADFNRLLRDTRGQDLIEYAVLSSFIALLVMAAAVLLGTRLNDWLGSLGSAVSSAP